MSAAPGTPLYHVGCGRHLYDWAAGQQMALSCPCGADAPIMVADLNDPEGRSTTLPSSIIHILA